MLNAIGNATNLTICVNKDLYGGVKYCIMYIYLLQIECTNNIVNIKKKFN